MKIKRIIEIEDNFEGMSLEEALHDLSDCVFPVAGGKSVAFAIEILRAIAQSIPYNPTGDCISREALKQEMKIANAEAIDYEMLVDMYEKLVDNAQAVEPFEPDYVGAERLKARQRGYEEGYHNGMKIGKTLNPKIKQGEWIDRTNFGYVECPFCSEKTTCFDKAAIRELHFCFNCGADMRGGEDK